MAYREHPSRQVDEESKSYPTAPREPHPKALCGQCIIDKHAARIIYTTRLEAATDELVAKVQAGYRARTVLPIVAQEHKVGVEDLRGMYALRVFDSGYIPADLGEEPAEA